jgi:hypothetical protein
MEWIHPSQQIMNQILKVLSSNIIEEATAIRMTEALAVIGITSIF